MHRILVFQLNIIRMSSPLLVSRNAENKMANINGVSVLNLFPDNQAAMKGRLLMIQK
jgi:hypothetical protein